MSDKKLRDLQYAVRTKLAELRLVASSLPEECDDEVNEFDDIFKELQDALRESEAK